MSFVKLEGLMADRGCVASIARLEASAMASREALRKARTSLDEGAIAKSEGKLVACMRGASPVSAQQSPAVRHSDRQ